MKRSVKTVLLFATLVLLGSHTIGHHSPVMFNRERELTLKGTVRRFEWTNPDVSIQLEVANDTGDQVAWVIESQGPRVMTIFGWSNSLMPGDRVTVSAHPERTGDRRTVLGRSVLKQDGTLLKISWQPDEIRNAIRAQ